VANHNAHSQDRHTDGSLLGSKQSRPDDTAQQAENHTQSLNSHSWQNPSGTWNAPQESTNRTDEYGFPIRSEAPINSREFPTLAASKQSVPSKQRTQQDQVCADDADTSHYPMMIPFWYSFPDMTLSAGGRLLLSG
jgi:hypothetical protein